MVGIVLKETQPLRRSTQRMAPPHDAVLKAQASKLGWMTATFVPTKKLSSAWERCSSHGPGQRPWFGVITSSSMWTSVIAQCHPNYIAGSLRFFFRNMDCSSEVHWFVFGSSLGLLPTTWADMATNTVTVPMVPAGPHRSSPPINGGDPDHGPSLVHHLGGGSAPRLLPMDS